MEQVFDLLTQRHESASQSGLFIKLSPGSVTDAALLKRITMQIQKLKIEPRQLVFQVRENLIHGNMKEVKTLAQGLHEAGCRFAIDHLGDSGQPLPALDHLPVDFIKLAPHLTQTLGETPQTHVKLRQIMERAQELKIKTVAEYVQNANAMAQLWQLGVNFIQGNYVQPPEVVQPYGEVEAG
jgi:EAL domain-containing protein (putative c-di-GMP-specific phosphodiesterase class I)